MGKGRRIPPTRCDAPPYRVPAGTTRQPFPVLRRPRCRSVVPRPCIHFGEEVARCHEHVLQPGPCPGFSHHRPGARPRDGRRRVEPRRSPPRPRGDCADAYPVSALADGDQPVTGLTVTASRRHHARGLHRRGPRRPPGRHRARTRHGHGATVLAARSTASAASGRACPARRSTPRTAGSSAPSPTASPGVRPPVAGVTPFEDMDNYLAARRHPATVAGRRPRRARDRGRDRRDRAPRPPRASASCAMPLGVSGVSGSRLDAGRARPRRDKHRGCPPSTYAMGAAAAAGRRPGRRRHRGRRQPRRRAVLRRRHRRRRRHRHLGLRRPVVGFGHPMTFSGDDHAGHAPGRRALHPGGLARRAVQGRQPRRARRHHHRRPPDRHHRRLRRLLPDDRDVTSTVSVRRPRSAGAASHVAVDEFDAGRHVLREPRQPRRRPRRRTPRAPSSRPGR